MIVWIACIIGAYLIGSIPFGVMIGRARGVDIRQYGSKNIGATNVTRILGKRLGMLCFFLDFLKGAAPVLTAGLVLHVFARDAHELSSDQLWLWLAVAVAAVLGHMFSPFLGFKGGKGVATGFGALVAMYPILTWPALGAIVVWYVALRLFKYVSLASMLAVVSLPIGYLLSVIPRQAQDQAFSQTLDQLLHASPPLIGTAAIALLVIYQHRSNIGRLRRGEEPKTGKPLQRDAQSS